MRLSSSFIYKLRTNNGKIRLIIISILALCLIVISIIFFSMSISRPYMGFNLSLINQDWEVQSLDPNGLAINAGIIVGDRPVEINGQPADTFLDKYREQGFVHGLLIQDITFSDDNGHLKSVSLIDHHPTWQSITESISWLFVSVLFWITGLFAFYKRPSNFAALLLCLCGLCFGLGSSSNLAGERAIITAVPIAVSATIIGPWILLHFFLALPEERAWSRNNPWVYIIYLPALITIIIFFLIGYVDSQPTPGFRTIRLLEFGVGFLTAVILAFINYFGASSVRTRQQMKIVLFSSLAALIPFWLLIILPATIYDEIPSGFNLLFLGLIPIGMGYAVVTKKLMDIDIIIRRGLIYGLITFVMAIILSIAIFFTLAYHETLGVTGEILVAIALGGVATFLFGPIKKRAELVIDKLFYKDRYDYRQIIQGLSASLNSVNDLTEISRLVVGTTVNVLNLGGGCLFVKTRSNFFELCTAQGTFIDKNRQNELLVLISQHNQAIEFPNTASTVNADVAYLIPLVAVNEEIGFLCVSQKVSRQDFSSDDLFLLQGIAFAAAIELHSAMLTRDVSIRDTFVSVASHELRTPLTSIVGYADLLLNRNPPEATKKQWIKRIFDNSQRLSAMVDDLLNVSRIQSGKVNLTLEKVRLSEVLEETILLAKEYAIKHEFVENIEPDLPVVLIDRDKLGQVVGNLLSNAIKYSPEGGCITLAIYNDSQNRQIVISVTDEGIGISPPDKESIFTTFHRVRRLETQHIRGSGLGLYIAKEWTEAMGGKIWLESEINKGSTFFIAIPTQASITLKNINRTYSVQS